MGPFFRSRTHPRWWRLLLPLLTLGGLLPGAMAQVTPPCDYTTTTIALNSAGGAGGGLVRYVLTDSVGIIRQVSLTPGFGGLSGTHSYSALAISYSGVATGLSPGQAVRDVSASCYAWSAALPVRVCVAAPALPDTDGDKVPDVGDRCPNTPAGTRVNAYGCPLSLTTCDYTTARISFGVTIPIENGSFPIDRYILADSVGTILRLTDGSVFEGLSGSHTYMALTIRHDGSATNLSVGQSLSAVSANCYAWSDALVVRVCVPPAPTACDYTVGEAIRLNESGGSRGTGAPATGPGAATQPADDTRKNYVLVNSAGLIEQVQYGPGFFTNTLTPGLYTAYVLVFTDDGSLVNVQPGKPLSAVRANCLVLSNPVPLKICAAQPCPGARCIPITVTQIRR